MRVGGRYRIDQMQDGDKLDIVLQPYILGTFDRHNLLGLYPVAYVFFEVFHFNKRFKLTTAFGVNRKVVVRTAKGITIAGALGIEFLLTMMFAYPIQIGRVKHLTRNKTIWKKLVKFTNLSDQERQLFLERQDRFIENA